MRMDAGATEKTDPVLSRRRLSAETVRLYASDWADFRAWCQGRGRESLPAEAATVTAYLRDAVRLGPGALARRLAAIAERHRRCGLAPPSRDPTLRILLRDAGHAAPPCRPPWLAAARLADMAVSCPDDLAGLRDRALLLLAATGLGRAALVGLDREDVRVTVTGIDLALRDHTGSRIVILSRARGIGGCPVRALDAWISASDCAFGPIFRKVDRWGNVEHRRLGTDAIRRILARHRLASRGMARHTPRQTGRETV